MAIHAKTLIAGIAIATVMSAASYADDTTDIENIQFLNVGPFDSTVILLVEDVETVAGQAGVLGNTLSVDYTLGNVNVSNSQTLDASGYAESVVDVNIATVGATSTAYAFGNSATISTCCGNIVSNSTQIVAAGNLIGAESDLNILNWAMNPNSSAIATANAISTTTAYGAVLDSTIVQDNEASVTSRSLIDAGGVFADSATVVSTAIANTGFAGGGQTTTTVNVNQTSNGPMVRAIGGLFGPSVEDAIVATIATGNNFSIENSYGVVRSDVTQENSAYINAQTDVDMGVWGNYNSASAYAIANSNLVSNIGDDIFVDNIQLNTGDVEALAEFASSGAGGVGYSPVQVVSSAAFGNAVSGYVCSVCNGAITANNNQTNSASITSTTNITASNGGNVIGTATAIGNSATFHSNTGN